MVQTRQLDNEICKNIMWSQNMRLRNYQKSVPEIGHLDGEAKPTVFITFQMVYLALLQWDSQIIIL